MDHQDKEDYNNTIANRAEHERPPAPAGPYPWLVYSDGEDQIFFNISDTNKSERRRIPELQNTWCWASSHGWCVLSDESYCWFFLWNPITLEKIDLPQLHNDYYNLDHCVLSSSPNETGCRVLIFRTDHLVILTLEIGDAEWKELDYKQELKRCFLESNITILDQRLGLHFLCNPIICNGKLYAESNRIDTMFLIDLETEKGKIVLQHLKINPPRLRKHLLPISSYFVESNGEIYQIYIILDGIEREIVVGVEVYRLDFCHMVWVKVETLKNSVFFLRWYSISYPAIKSDEIQGNQLYFPCDESGELYSYNMQDGSLSVVAPFPNHASNDAFWVMPHPRILSHKKEEAEDINQECMEKDVCFSRLPSHITPLITKHLNLVHYLNLHATCRLLRSMFPIQQKSFMNEIENHSLSTWLMFFEKDSICTFFNPKHADNKYYLKLPQELVRLQIHYSIGGWLLMSGGNRDFTYFYNPFIGEILKFRNIPRKVLDNVCMSFSISPTSLEWTVVDIIKFDNHMLVSFASCGDARWSFRIIYNDTDFAFSGNRAVFYKGAFYYLGQQGNLGVLQIRTDSNINVTWKVPPYLQNSCSDEYNECFLVECDGELLSVFVGRFENSVRVFKLDQLEMFWNWIEVETLNEYMIFVSRSSSFSAIADTQGMENKIYFPRFHGYSIVYYDLNTKKFHSFDQKDSPVVEFHKTREQLYCVWIEPKTGLITKTRFLGKRKRSPGQIEEGLRFEPGRITR